MIFKEIDKTIEIKIVYYGPALSGKTTSIKALFRHFGKDRELYSIESTVKRTLFFDYGTMTFQYKPWKLKMHLYSTTGQDFYVVTRPITLKAIDALIFIVDSQKKAYERNLISWNELHAYFQEDLFKFPMILCFNKQDLPNKFNYLTFLREIGYFKNKYDNIAIKTSIALNGEGVLDSFETILSLTFRDMYIDNLIPVSS